jgi:hypothetical protein
VERGGLWFRAARYGVERDMLREEGGRLVGGRLCEFGMV